MYFVKKKAAPMSGLSQMTILRKASCPNVFLNPGE